jgi:dTDP-4-dehydrorhamnose 3,5-epimerase
VVLFKRDIHVDNRGNFSELWREAPYRAAGAAGPFVQDNLSMSRRGVLRGLHYQWPHAQGKLVSVLQGSVFDVAVDIRQGSPTFAQWVGAELSAENGCQLWIPRGFAHGFVVLSDLALFHYKVDGPYVHEDEVTVAWDDKQIGIVWPVDDPVVGEKDATAARLEEISADKLPVFSPLQ